MINTKEICVCGKKRGQHWRREYCPGHIGYKFSPACRDTVAQLRAKVKYGS